MILRIFRKGAYDKLFGKKWRTSAELSIAKALERLNMNREKQKIILKRKQETAVEELFVGRDVMAILPTGFGKSKN